MDKCLTLFRMSDSVIGLFQASFCWLVNFGMSFLVKIHLISPNNCNHFDLILHRDFERIHLVHQRFWSDLLQCCHYFLM